MTLHSNEATTRKVKVAVMAKAIPESMPVRTTIFHVFFNSNHRKFFETSRNTYRLKSSWSHLEKVREKRGSIYHKLAPASKLIRSEAGRDTLMRRV